MDANVIGEGTYGCIHKPSLHCDGDVIDNYNNKVSKILSTKHAEKELSEYSTISTIDKRHQYYLGKPTECQPDDSEYNRSAIKKCKNADELNHDLGNVSLIVMEDGGINLETFADNARKWKTTPENRRRMELFWIEFHRVLKGIQLFLKKNVLHLDMKPQNIVYDETKNRVNIIDFGLTHNINTIISRSKESVNGLAGHHWSYPFEFMFHNKDTFDKMSGASDEQKEKYCLKVIKNVDNREKDKTSRAFLNFFSFVIEDSDNYDQLFTKYMKGVYENIVYEIIPENYNDVLITSLRTTDIYGTGIAIAYVANKTKHLMGKEFTQDMGDLVYAMTDPVVFRRYEIDRVIKTFEGILEKYNALSHNNVRFEKHKVVRRDIPVKITQHIKSVSAKNIVLSKDERSSDPIRIKAEKPCPHGHLRNSKTRRCRKVCPKGTVRDPKTRRCNPNKKAASTVSVKAWVQS